MHGGDEKHKSLVENSEETRSLERPKRIREK